MTTVALVCLHAALLAAVLRQQPTANVVEQKRSPWLTRLYHDAAATVGPGADFFALYHAGVNARRGESVFELHEEPRMTPYYYPYRYLPITAHTLGRVITTLAPRAAWMTWVAAIELSLLVALLAFRRAFRQPARTLAATAVLLLSAPYWLELYLGQFTFVATALTCVAILELGGKKRVVRSAVLWAAACLLKVFPLIVLPALWRERTARIVALGVIAGVAASNLPLFLMDPASADAFWAKNFLGEPVGLDAGNHGVLYVVFRVGEMIRGSWHLPTWGALTIVWRALVLAATIALVLKRRAVPVETAAALLLVGHFVSYFQVWEHHMSGAIAAGLLLCAGLERSGRAAACRIALPATVALALPTPFILLGPDVTAWSPLEQLLPPLSKSIPLAILYGCGVWAALVGAREEPVERLPDRDIRLVHD